MLKIVQRKDTQEDSEGISKFISEKYEEDEKKIFICTHKKTLDGFNIGSTGAKCLASHNFSSLITLSLGKNKLI